MSFCHKNWHLSRCALPPPQGICSDPQGLETPSDCGVRPWSWKGARKTDLQPWQPEEIGPNVWGRRRDRRFQRGVLKKDLWSCCRRASRELSLIRIVSTLLPGLQRTFCPCDGDLSLSTTSSLTGANYLKTQNKILGSRKDVLLLHPFPGHLLRAAPSPHVPLPSANPTEAGS